MARPLKTLFLLEDLCYGGTQKQNLALARRLDRQKFAPEILTLTGPTDLDADVGDLPLRHLGSSRSVAPFFFARLPFALARLAPDILVPCTALPNIWGRIWGSLLSVPVIIGTCRGGGAPARQHEWLLARLASGFVCNSRPLAQIMAAKGVDRQKLRYIPNGVDTDLFCPADCHTDELLIVSVGRLAADKDQKTLLAAFALIAEDFPEARLRLVGEGPEEARLKEYCRENLEPRAAARVEFAGACHQPAPHYQEAAIFALSSIREGQPNVILEAMSCGLPICATSVGGIPDLVTDNGFLSPPAQPAALAANLRLLLADAGMRRRMGANGRKRVCADFSFAAMTSAHEDFFLRLWEERNA